MHDRRKRSDAAEPADPQCQARRLAGLCLWWRVRGVKTAHLRLLQLAIVDLDGEEPGQYDELLKKLSRTPGMLLIVCGNDNDIDEEIAIRELGVWLYLPGVSDTCNLSLLCGEAKQIVSRIDPEHKPGDRKPQTTVGRTQKRPQN